MTLRHAALVGDIGGTHAAFGLVAADGSLHAESTVSAADHPSIEAAIDGYLDRAGAGRPEACVLAAAGPVIDGRVSLTNSPWEVDSRRLADRGFGRVRVLNDFEALALSLPSLRPDELQQLGGGAAVAGAPCAVLGPGTGLGVAGLVPCGDHWVPVPGEGGHVTMAPVDDVEAEILADLRGRFGHVSAERVICGNGLVTLYEAQARRAGLEPAMLSPELVTAAARTADGPERRAVDMFCGMLGTLAGNVALTFGARGGIYVGGGIPVKLADVIRASCFRERFEAKGRFAGYLREIPTWIILAHRPGLRGAARLAVEPAR